MKQNRLIPKNLTPEQARLLWELVDNIAAQLWELYEDELLIIPTISDRPEPLPEPSDVFDDLPF